MSRGLEGTTHFHLDEVCRQAAGRTADVLQAVAKASVAALISNTVDDWLDDVERKLDGSSG